MFVSSKLTEIVRYTPVKLVKSLCFTILDHILLIVDCIMFKCTVALWWLTDRKIDISRSASVKTHSNPSGEMSKTLWSSSNSARRRFLGRLDENTDSQEHPTMDSQDDFRTFDSDKYINALHLAGIENISSKALQRKLLIIDLDETLVHTSTRSSLFTPWPPKKLYSSFKLEIPFPSHPIPVLYYVYKRPYVIEFLQQVSQWYDIAIYTASVRQYANVVIDHLEKESGITVQPELRFFREHCISTHNNRSSSPSLFSRRDTSSMVTMTGGAAPVGPSANMFTKNIALVAKRWLSIRKVRRTWKANARSLRRRRRIMQSSETELGGEQVPSSSDASTDIDEDEVEKSLARVILLDNSTNSFMLQPFNGFPIQQWINDPGDQLLRDILPIMDALRFVVDVRAVLGLRVFDQLIGTIQQQQAGSISSP